MTLPVPPPDDKDWTWVISAPCRECGFDPATVGPATLADRLARAAARWPAVLTRPDVAQRPSSLVWSPLEYAAHVRDVYELFGRRAALMLEQDDPQFDNWDQDATALERDYAVSDPATVAAEIAATAAGTVPVFSAVTSDAWERTGRRSNGSRFTVATLGVYFLHDVEHHLHDVGA
ncbi:DinB family protein [Nakamurella leprariae]|uniref:DinB family protein n=1 Tax=Nakamurella leprariae TaxID=2803911 RepID=A0A938YKR4_9ACTN|nr:DinB family protein [Nakamurella leprariae]MBM9469580.1 DinB family protein [Nakamurella leprariae]